MSTFSGSILNNGPTQIGDGNTQNNSGTFSYSYGQAIEDISNGFDDIIYDIRNKGNLEDGEIKELEHKKQEIIDLMAEAGGAKNKSPILVEKTTEYVDILSKTVSNIENGVDSGKKLYSVVEKMLPFLIPTLGKIFGIL